MVFYASQVLHQSEGSEEGAALSHWIESEVARLRESYEVIVQKYYSNTVDMDAE